MGLDSLLTERDSITFARRTGSTMFLLPLRHELYFASLRASGMRGSAHSSTHLDLPDRLPEFVSSR